MKSSPVTTPRFDLSTHSLGRTLRQDLRFRCIPIGHFGEGPNLQFMPRLIWLHTFETCWQNLKIRLEPFYPMKRRA